MLCPPRRPKEKQTSRAQHGGAGEGGEDAAKGEEGEDAAKARALFCQGEAEGEPQKQKGGEKVGVAKGEGCSAAKGGKQRKIHPPRRRLAK